MVTLFISDLHLAPERPAMIERFQSFLESEARSADALYILGDFFEAWIGDDAPLPEYRTAMAAVRKLADRGVPVYFMRGNRDFLVGSRFARETGCHLLDDPTVVDLYGEPTALLHGDSLCTDDRAHQRMRALFRRSWMQKTLLALPEATRLRLAARLRASSRRAMARKDAAMMDVNADAVAAIFRGFGVGRLIHGHTHRPGRHIHDVDGRHCERLVLGDWYEQGSVLRCDNRGMHLATL